MKPEQKKILNLVQFLESQQFFKETDKDSLGSGSIIISGEENHVPYRVEITPKGVRFWVIN